MATDQKQVIKAGDGKDGGAAVQRQSINPLWVVVEMAIFAGLIVLFNFFPERIGVRVSAGDPASFVPLLTAEFAAYMPWLNLFWGLGLALCLAKLFTGRWTPLLRLADFGLNIFAIVILIRLILGGPLVIEDRWPRELIPDAGTFARRLLPWLSAVKIWLALALLGSILEAVRKLRHLPIFVPVITLRRDGRAAIKGLKEDSSVTMEWLTPNDLADGPRRPGQ